MSLDDSKLFSISDEPDDSSFVPIYNVNLVIDIDSEGEDDSKAKKKKQNRNSCWNCGGTGHSLRQCPSPHNAQNINKNRSSFNTRVEFKRYHVDVQHHGDKKENPYPHLKPGIISDKLREALGINHDQLPKHIYRMRCLGYPPGWLLEAKVDSSGIEMFDADGNRVPNADEEEGEIGPSVDILYEESKIITYPGFNEYPAPGTIDETDEYGVPPLEHIQTKEEFIKSLNKLKPPNISAFPKQLQNIIMNSTECDMETEDIEDLPEDNNSPFVPPLPMEPPPPPPEDPEEEMDSSGDRTVTADGATPEKNIVSDATHGRVKSSALGTPALKIHSPYQKLPPPEAFRKGVSDVINFENLPDSTGAYEKLKGVLKNVRSKLSVIKDGKMNATI